VFTTLIKGELGTEGPSSFCLHSRYTSNGVIKEFCNTCELDFVFSAIHYNAMFFNAVLLGI